MKTAVEWLIKELICVTDEYTESKCEQAKEMEKEQTTTFARHWWVYGSHLTPVDYYEQTFKK